VGELSLENYVIALKDLVRVEALRDIVGIGKENGLSNFTENSIWSPFLTFSKKKIYQRLEQK